jgi:hypothetical protein
VCNICQKWKGKDLKNKYLRESGSYDETSTFVSEVMQEYNLSAGVRLALELLPSMFLYSRTRRISKEDNLVSDDQYKSAISQLNSL